VDPGRHAARPRLVSTLVNAISRCREIEVLARDGAAKSAVRHRLQPHELVVRPPEVHLVAYPAESSATAGPLTLDITRIQKVKLLDSSFTRRADDGTRDGG